jgi:hypothetical protein
MTLDSNSLPVASGGSITSGSSSRYAVIKGTGVLMRNNEGASSVIFPVGISSTHNPFLKVQDK